jgi:hypothetical protein
LDGDGLMFGKRKRKKSGLLYHKIEGKRASGLPEGLD